MIALAANGYAELYTLLERGDDVPIDAIKCPLSPNSRVEVERALNWRPALLHSWGPPEASACQPEIPEPELLRELAALTRPPFVSLHLDYRPERDGDLTRDALLQRIRSNVAALTDLARAPILLENVPWYPWQTRPRWVTDPEFIADALAASGADLLIDTAHARVAAWHRGEDAAAYLSALPLHKAREVHTSGPRLSDGEGLRDRHMALRDEDWALLDLCRDSAPQIEFVTLEYAGRRERTAHYGEPDGPELLAEQLARLDLWRRR